MGRHRNFTGVDEDELRRKYIDENKPMHTVAEEMGVAVGTVYNYLKKYNIQSRKQTDYPITDKQRQAGRRAWEANRGRKLSIETRRKISLARIKGGIGHKKQRADGYIAVYFPDHPRSSTDGYIMEHILVMEALVGRHLETDECVIILMGCVMIIEKKI
jgi:hypothetical protein